MTTEVSADLARYYETIAPFYDDEMALRTDVPKWREIVARSGARSVLELGCGGGRVARALRGIGEVVGIDALTPLLPPDPGFEFVQADMRQLPFRPGRFDLAIAANDPFAHLLEDDDRSRALDEAGRVASRVVIDALSLTAADDARARADGLIRRSALPSGIERHETWRAQGHTDRYLAIYRYVRDDAVLAEAATVVRAWSTSEPALRGRRARLYGDLDGRPYDADSDGLVISIGGAL